MRNIIKMWKVLLGLAIIAVGTAWQRSDTALASEAAFVVQVAAGKSTGTGTAPSHSLGLKSDGSIWAWGDNSKGQLGDGTTTNRTAPVQVTGLGGVKAIAAGSEHSLALKSDGTVWAWGSNGNGQIGNGTTVNESSPIQVAGLSDVIAISTGYYYNIALKNDGTAFAWGANNRGQLGDGTMTDRLTPVQVNGLTDAAAISAGGTFALALKSDKTVWGWGFNSVGQLGIGTTATKLAPVQVPGVSDIKAIAAGASHALALASDGTVQAWGYNSSGQLGDGTTTNRLTPVAVPGLNGVTSLSAGFAFSLALRSDGTVKAWGSNSKGQLGIGSYTSSYTPVSVVGLSDVTAVSAGEFQSLALLKNGMVAAWGENKSGQLGIGNAVFRTSPAQAAITDVVYLEAGSNYSLALKRDGTVWAWGSNQYGILDDGTTVNRPEPSRTSVAGAVYIAAGSYHNLALKNDGTVWAWGNNSSGELGIGTTDTQSAPVQTSGLTGVKAIAAGDKFNFAVKTDGTVWAWGANFYNSLGDGTSTARLTPVQVPNLSGITAVSAGYAHGLALKNDGTVWAWGFNMYGQMGNGVAGDSQATPVQVAGLTDVVAIDSGSYTNVAVKSDGTVWAWGYNSAGQIGNGVTGGNQTTPTQVTGLTGGTVKAILGGLSHGLVLKNDGTVWSWGTNKFGQLGDGTTVNRTSATQVPDLSGITAVSGGAAFSLALKDDGTVWGWGYEYDGQVGDGVIGYLVLPVTLSAFPSNNADLSDLQVNGTTVAGFTSGSTGPYRVSVPNGSTAVSVAYTKADSQASVTVSGDTNLAVGDNTVTVTVTAANGSTKTYTVIVHRISGNADLSDLQVNGTTVAGFTPNQTGPYRVNVPNDATVVSVTYTKADNQASVAVSGGTNLSLGDNTLTVTVTAENGATQTYSVIVRRLSDNAGLTDLQVNGVTVAGFEPGNTGPYRVSVPNSFISVDVAYIQADSQASVVVSGGTNLSVGDNAVTVTVTAENGAAITYSITVRRLSGNADLTDLQVNDSTVGGFGSDNTGPYRVSVPNASGTAAVTYTQADSKANVMVSGDTNLTVGDNAFSVTVTAEDGTIKTYSVIVNRAQISFYPSSSSGSGNSSPSQGSVNPSDPSESAGGAASVSLNGVQVKTAVTKETASGGQTALRFTVDGEQLEAALTTASSPVKVLVIDNTDPVVIVDLPVKALLAGAGSNPNTVFQIKVNGASYSLPSSLLNSIPKETSITVTIAQVSGAAKEAADAAAARLGVQPLLEHPLDYSISTDGGVPVSDFNGTFVERTMTVNKQVDPAKTTAVWVDEDGQMHFIPSYFEQEGEAAVVTIRSPHDSVYTVVQANKTFEDVKGHWAQTAIESLASKLVVDGVTKTDFAPNAPITRAEFAALLIRSFGISANDRGKPFSDVKPDDWFAANVQAAVKAGLVEGFEDGTFRPNAPITREQMAVMISKALKFAGYSGSSPESKAVQGQPIARFTDASTISGWAKEAVNLSVQAGVINGRTDAIFAPGSNATRAEAVEMLDRMLRSLKFIN
ncbi:cadherin-like beta sandwich domain-containing protein [Paenibacillus thalictri]|uniref:SLH domain-containing protein n=1 Tax=Paenibacillus thalictri TaxID=2527873 RepID=A0A4Q9E0G7_9BACL|nr:S-layer homology domain-containing protein [Paenibacillus thalictri]TBL81031.1 hypothetical protein EYB31_02745 [Paenibacillus thalictri]